MNVPFLTDMMLSSNISANGSTNLTNVILSLYYTELSENDSFLNDMNSFLNIRVVLAWSSLLIIVIGIVTNSVSCIAFFNPKTLSSTNIYLASLCVCDSIALLGLLINSAVYSKFIYYEYLAGIRFVMMIYPYIYPMIATSQIASIYLTVCVSINQFLFVAFSRAQGLRNNKSLKRKDNKRAFCIVAFIMTMSIAFCVPYWFTFQYTNERGLEKTEISKSAGFKNIVHLYLYLPFACVIPFIVLMITNTYLICTLESVNRRKRKISFRKAVAFKKMSTDANTKNMVVISDLNHTTTITNNTATTITTLNTSKQQQQRQQLIKTNNKATGSSGDATAKFERKNKTLMLITVVFFFLICQSPTLLLHLIESLQPHYKNHFYYAHLVEISKILLIINLSFNFAIFYLFSKKFRDTLKESLSLFNKRGRQQSNDPIVI